jgi:hypothetical protein
VNVTRHIAIIGDYDPTSLSHRAIPIAIATAAVILNHEVKTTELSALAARIHPLVISFVQYVTEDDDVQGVA